MQAGCNGMNIKSGEKRMKAIVDCFEWIFIKGTVLFGLNVAYTPLIVNYSHNAHVSFVECNMHFTSSR